MKRRGNLYEQIISLDNLRLADQKAAKGKSRQYGVRAHQRHREENLLELHEKLVRREYRTSAYFTFRIFEPKERLIQRLPYFPDRVLQHAILNVIGPVLISTFTADTYSCLPGRGIHRALYNTRAAVKGQANAKYCLKLDVKRYFQSIDHGILKTLLRRKLKDLDLLNLLDEIIDSCSEGLPIGSYLSSTFANFYLSGLDHYLKEVERVGFVARYMDDIVVLHDDKSYLHELRLRIAEYLREHLRLQVKENWQVFPVADRGLDFVGYRIYPTHTLLRKRTKQNFVRMTRENYNERSINSYRGWLRHCDGGNLWRKYVHLAA